MSVARPCLAGLLRYARLSLAPARSELGGSRGVTSHQRRQEQPPEPSSPSHAMSRIAAAPIPTLPAAPFFCTSATPLQPSNCVVHAACDSNRPERAWQECDQLAMTIRPAGWSTASIHCSDCIIQLQLGAAILLLVSVDHRAVSLHRYKWRRTSDWQPCVTFSAAQLPSGICSYAATHTATTS